MKIKIFTQSAADALKKYVAESGDLALYDSARAPNWRDILGEDCSRETTIDIVGESVAGRVQKPAVKITADDNSGDGDKKGTPADAKRDIVNSLSVYQALGNITPQQATDERLWLHLTHCELWGYTRARWPLPDSLAERREQIETHYLVPKNRGLIRNNAVARLWWMGFAASRCEFYDAKKALQILLYRSDVRANVLERPSLAASGEIFNGVMKMLGESYGKQKELFSQRDKYREIMKKLNQVGGRRMLNEIGPNGVYEMCKEFAGGEIS